MRLQLYVLRELLVDFAFAVGGMLVLALPAIAVAAVSKLAGVDTRAILYFVPLLVAGLVPYVLPLGYLLAVVVAYGRLSADNEWTAIRMARWNPAWMLLPPLALALAVSGFTLWLVAEKLPEVNRRQKEYQVRALRETATRLAPGRTELRLGKFYISAAWRDLETADFIDALIYIPGRTGEPSKTIVAQRVGFQFQGRAMIVRLLHPRIVHGSWDVRSEIAEIRLDMDELQREPESSYSSMRYRKSSEIRASLARGEFASDPVRARAAVFEIHQRIAISVTSIMFLALGVPTGLLLRRGTQLSALSVAVGYALLYYVLSMRLSKELAMSSLLTPVLGAWTINLVGFAIGTWLLRRALRR